MTLRITFGAGVLVATLLSTLGCAGTSNGDPGTTSTSGSSGDTDPSATVGGSDGSPGEADGTGLSSTATGSDGSTDADATGNWWGTTGGASFTAGAGENGGPGEEESGEDEEDEEIAEIFGEGAITPGTSYEGLLEVLVISGGVEQCVLFFDTADVTWLDTCAECQFAFSYTLTNMEAVATEGCAAVGIDPQALDGSTQTAGLGGKQLYQQVGDVWQPSGEAFYEEAESLFTYAYPLPG